MNRVLTFLISSSLFLVAASPKDQQITAERSNPTEYTEEEAEEAASKPILPSKAMEAALQAEAAKHPPNEREAIIAAKGGAGFDDRGHMKGAFSNAATDADVKLFAAVEGLEVLHIGPLVMEPIEGRCVEGPRISDAGLAPLVKTPKLRELVLVETQITDEALKFVGEMAGLESLGLVRCPRITGAGMAHLDGLKHLEILSLEGSPVGDDGMKSVGGHDSLRRLYLGWPVSRRGLAELVRLKSLEELTIYGNLKDDDFVPIGQMTNLKSLRFAMGGLTDEGLRHLSNMTRLRSLNLTESQATDAGMAFVGQMTGLEVLTLNERIGDAGIAHLIALPNLQGLSLRATKVSDAGIATLIGLPKLRRLDLVETHVTAVGVEHLRGMKSLESIDLSYTEISDGDVEKLKDSGIPVSKLPGSLPNWIIR